nr:TlpA disulfide reductase family protein [Corynebacterium lactis]
MADNSVPDNSTTDNPNTQEQGADINRSASLIALVIALVCVVGLVAFALTRTSGTSDPLADGSDAQASQAAPEQQEPVLMSSDEIAAIAGSGSLSGVKLPHLFEPAAGEAGAGANGVDVGQAIVGKPTVVNVWAWNCAPCRQELPLIEQWVKDNPDVRVITVHAAREAQRGRNFLAEIGVDLETYSDTVDVVGPALNLPRVVPISVIFYPDGKVAKMHPGEFTSAEEITQTVRGALS